MAISGSKQISAGSGLTLSFSWERTSYSIPNKTSTISWKMELISTGIGAFIQIGKDRDWYVLIDNNRYSGTANVGIGLNQTKTLASGTTTLNHYANGFKTFSYTFSQDMKEVKSASGYFELDAIPVASSITCTTTSIGTAPTITINTNSATNTHTLSYGFGNQELGYITGIIAEKTTATKINNFVWPTSFYQVIPNSTSGTGTIFCETYSGSVLVGQTTYTFTANANATASTPTISPIIKDSNATTIALTGDSNNLIRYFSTASITINAEAKNYATIASQKAKCGTAYFTTPTGAIGNIQSAYFTFEATDSRGYSTSVGRDLSVAGRFIDYYLPTCTIGNDMPDANGNMTVHCSGTWFSDSFGAQNNTLTAQYRYKEKDGAWSNWASMSVATSADTYEATAYLSNLDYQKIYIFETRAIDKLATVSSSESAVISLPIFHWSKDDFVFEVPVTFKKGTTGASGGGDSDTDLSSGGTINGDLTITGNLRLKGAGNYGNTLYFGDGSYANISEPSDDTLTVKASTINLNGNVLVNGNAIGGGGVSVTNGTWIPSLSSAAISSYTVRQGWYQKVGNVVTLGFNIKATCNSGYSSESISISGIPFTPIYDASGGGVCSGTYTSGNFNFECWVVGTGGTITGRVQNCNHTSTTNLSTTASGLFYRNGGGEITLGGTICYITN